MSWIRRGVGELGITLGLKNRTAEAWHPGDRRATARISTRHVDFVRRKPTADVYPIALLLSPDIGLGDEETPMRKPASLSFTIAPSHLGQSPYTWYLALLGIGVLACAIEDHGSTNDGNNLASPNLRAGGNPASGGMPGSNALAQQLLAASSGGFRAVGGTPGFSGIVCSVFDDGFARQTGKADAVYFSGPYSACIPDGTPKGTCRKWFGNCEGYPSPWNSSVTFSIFDDGATNKVSGVSAAFINANGQACVSDGTPSGTCRRWFGEPILGAGYHSLSWSLFNDDYTNYGGATRAIYYRGPSQVCKPDGTATGTCRKWFGRGSVD